MGTLHAQTPRTSHNTKPLDVEYFYQQFEDAGFPGKMTFQEYIEVQKVLEYARRTDFMLDNGDRWDEQISGIGKLVESIDASLNVMANTGEED